MYLYIVYTRTVRIHTLQNKCIHTLKRASKWFCGPLSTQTNQLFTQETWSVDTAAMLEPLVTAVHYSGSGGHTEVHVPTLVL